MKNLCVIAIVAIAVVSCKFTDKGSGALESKPTLKGSVSLKEQKILNGFHQDILNLKTANQVDPLLIKFQKIAAEQKDFKVVQAYSLVLTRLRLFKGIFWRLRTIIDDCALCHIRAIGAIRVVYLRRNSMGPHFKAILDYIVHPHDDVLNKSNGGGQFHSVSEFQNEMEGMLFKDHQYPGFLPIVSMEKAAQQLEGLISQIPSDLKFDFDMRVLAGLDLISQSKQSKTAVRSNLVQVLARVYRNMAFLSYFVNYNFDGLSVFFNNLVQTRGLQSLASNLLSGIKLGDNVPLPNTAREFVGILNSNNKSIQALGTLRTGERAPGNIRKSALFFYKGVLMRDLAFTGLQSEFVAGKDSYVTHPNWFGMNSTDVKSALNQRKKIFGSVVKMLKIPVTGALSKVADSAVTDKGQPNGRVKIISNRTGAPIDIRPLALFFTVDPKSGQPMPHTNLRAFLPAIPQGQYANKVLTPEQKKAFGISLKAVAWNYDYGKAHQWRDPTMGGLFPEVKNSMQLQRIATEMRMNSGTRRIVSYLPFL